MGTSNRHLGPGTLRYLADGDSPVEPAQLDHLVQCDSCAANLIQLFPEDIAGRVYDLLDEALGPPPVTDLPPVLCRLFAAYRRCREEHAAAAPEAVAALLAMSQKERLAAVREQPRIATLPVAEALLEEIPNWWHRDPHHAGDLAEVALTILEPLDPAAPFLVPPSRALEALAHAWALRGNAMRVQGDLAQAEQCLEHAGELAEQTGNLAANARVARLLTELLRDQRRFEEAAEACREAEELYTEADDQRMVARARVLRGIILGERGDHEGAVAVLQNLLDRGGRDRMGEKHYLAAVQSLCHELVEAGQPDQALLRLEEVEVLTAQLEEPLVRCRITWVRALALAETGERDRAEYLLRQILQTFLAQDMPYDAALAGLDLAASYLCAGKLGLAKDLAQELTPVFLSRGVHREATAAGLLVTHALERQTATLCLLRDVGRFLNQARRDPSLRYKPSAK